MGGPEVAGRTAGPQQGALPRLGGLRSDIVDRADQAGRGGRGYGASGAYELTSGSGGSSGAAIPRLPPPYPVSLPEGWFRLASISYIERYFGIERCRCRIIPNQHLRNLASCATHRRAPP